MRNKVINIISFIDRSIVWEWMIDYFKDSTDLEYSFIILNPGSSALADFAGKRNVRVWEIRYRDKRDFPLTLLKVIKILLKEKPEIINTNLIDASIIGHIAAKITGIKIRINTRHHSSFHHDYFPHAIKYDLLVNKLSTNIVTASEIVKKFLVDRESVPQKKIEVINFGFKLDDFNNVSQERINVVRTRYNLNSKFPVIGVISRLIEWKGVQYTINAFKKILSHKPDSMLVIANAMGDYKPHIISQLNHINPDNYVMIEFEKDILALYKCFDIFIHVPVDSVAEAFGQIYIESLMSGIPSIFTLSGIAHDFIKHEYNALVVDYKSTDEIFEAMLKLVNSRSLSESLKLNGLQSVKERFDVNNMLRHWDEYYHRLLEIK